MNELDALKRKLERERKARKEAEGIMEAKALELFNANEELLKLNENLEHQVRKRTEDLQNSEIKYRGIIEKMELGLLEVDLNQNILRAYDWFCKMTDFEPHELEGKSTMDMILPDNIPDLFWEQDQTRQKGQAGVYELQIKKKDGSLIWVIISGSPVFNAAGEVVGSVGIHYDITTRKIMEQELAKAKGLAEAAEEAEKQFLARMSHEIRTPLNAVIGMTHLLYDTQPNLQQRDYLDGLKTSADILLKLISDILDISKIEAGEININEKEFDLKGLLNSLQKTFSLKSEREDIEVLIEIAPDIHNLIIGDDLLLNQILLNLLGNALKFTDEGKIGVRVKKSKKIRERTLFEFEVFDSGIGIPNEELNLIFENFKQANQQGKYLSGGTGLGLAICKQLIELQNGEISVKSTDGKGTTFKFSLPFIETEKEVHELKQEPKVQAPEFAAHDRILVVEDNFMNQKYVLGLLKKWGVNYDLANNGEEAVNMIQTQLYSLILMDIAMPIMDGYEATIHIRNRTNPNQNTPIVALTASAILSQKNQALEVGMTDYLAKPFKPAQLIEMIEKHIPQKIKFDIAEIQESSDFNFSKDLNNDYLT